MSPHEQIKPVVAIFLKEATEDAPGSYVAASQVYRAYRAWAGLRGLPVPLQIHFGRAVTELGYPSKIRTAKKRSFKAGLVLLPGWSGDSAH